MRQPTLADASFERYRKPARGGARYGGDLFTRTTTHLVAEHTADYGTGNGTDNLLVIFYRVLASNSHILADFTWHLHGLSHLCDVQNFRVGRIVTVIHRAIPSASTTRHSDDHADPKTG